MQDRIPRCEFREVGCVRAARRGKNSLRNVPGDEASTHVRLLPQSARSTITDQQIWFIAIGVIAVDILFAMVPIVPFLAAYVLIARPPWFKDFIDDVYDRA